MNYLYQRFLRSAGLWIGVWCSVCGLFADSPRKFTGHRGRVLALAFLPKGDKFLSAGGGNEEDSTKRDYSIRMWSVKSGLELMRIEGHESTVRCLDVNKTGTLAVSAGYDDVLRLWDLTTGRQIRSYVGHSADVNTVRFSPDNRTIISAGDDETVRIWDVNRAAEIRQLKQVRAKESSASRHKIYSVAACPITGRIFAGGTRSAIEMWEPERKAESSATEPVQLYRGHTKGVTSLCVSPDGKKLISGSWDKTVRVWDIESGKLLHTISAHTKQVWSVALSGDGKQIVSASFDGTVQMHELTSGKSVRVLKEAANELWVTAISPDGETVIAGSEDRKVFLWNLKQEK